MTLTGDFAQSLEQCIRDAIRNEFKFAQTSTVNKAAVQGAELVMNVIREQEQSAAMKGVKKLSFLDLPREIRDRIYEHLILPNGRLGGMKAYVGQHSRDAPRLYLSQLGVNNDIFGVVDWHAAPPVTRVSRQLREEALPMFYQLNEFVADMNEPKSRFRSMPQPKLTSAEFLIKWLKVVGNKNLQDMKKLYVLCADGKLGSYGKPIDEVLAQEGIVVSAAVITALEKSTPVDTPDQYSGDLDAALARLSAMRLF